MILHSLRDPGDGSSCTLIFDEQHDWLRATWKGFVDNGEAARGAESYLAKLSIVRCAYLLNDNSQIQGPWFDSVEWLQRTWAPQASQMGLRYVAHITHRFQDEWAVLHSQKPFQNQFEVQLFETVAEAEEWLTSCQAKAR